MIAYRRSVIHAAMIVRICRTLCLAVLIGIAAFAVSIPSTNAQLGAPLLRVYVDSDIVEPGNWVPISVVANGAGSSATLDVSVPGDLEVSDNVQCVHYMLYCSSVSVTSYELPNETRITARAPGTSYGTAVGPVVRLNFSVLIPESATASTRYEFSASVRGLFDILDPYGEGNNEMTFDLQVGGTGGTASSSSAPPPATEVPTTAQPTPQQERPTVLTTKLRCDWSGANVIEVEKQCTSIDDGGFYLEHIRSGDGWYLTSNRRPLPSYTADYLPGTWMIRDLSDDTLGSGSVIVTCLSALLQEDGEALVSRVNYLDVPGEVEIPWSFSSAGASDQRVYPLLECTWLEMPDASDTPAVLNLRSFSTTDPYIVVQGPSDPADSSVSRLDMAEQTEVSFSLVDADTGEAHTFTVDGTGIVVVPPGQYSLREGSHGLETSVFLDTGETFLVDVGVPPPEEEPVDPVATGLQTSINITAEADIHVTMEADGLVIFDGELAAGNSTGVAVGTTFVVYTSMPSATLFTNACGTEFYMGETAEEATILLEADENSCPSA